MRRFARLFMLALGLTILGLVVTLVPHKDVSAQSPTQVQVVNTPLPISGVVRAAVTNTPLPVTVRGIAVAAPLPVTGTVSVGNFPTPLFVQDVDSAGRHPFAVTAICQPNSAGVCVGGNPILPSTTVNGIPVQTVVIEFVSAVCIGLASGITQDVFDFGYTLNTQRNVVFFPAAVESGTGKMAMRTVLYADPGSQTDLGTPGNNSGCSVSLSGHLIPQ
jgi:hypothetical protein